MRSTTRLLLSALALTAAHTSLASAQLVGRDETVYTWRGTIPSGGQFTIRNFNGPIDVRPAAGNTAELRAEKRVRGGADVRDVGFEVRKSSGGDVEICSTQNEDTCYGDRRSHDGWRRQVTVAMTVLVPRGVRVKLSTGNGAVSVEGAGSDVEASTGNGRVRIAETQGQVRVSTGNGDVEVRNAKARVNVSTGNGDVSVVTVEGPGRGEQRQRRHRRSDVRAAGGREHVVPHGQRRRTPDPCRRTTTASWMRPRGTAPSAPTSISRSRAS
jgi:hypothetical protein